MASVCVFFAHWVRLKTAILLEHVGELMSLEFFVGRAFWIVRDFSLTGHLIMNTIKETQSKSPLPCISLPLNYSA